MKKKLSPRVYENCVDYVEDFLSNNGCDCCGMFREDAAKIVDTLTSLIYAGEKLAHRPMADRTDCPVCHGATCFHWSEGVDMPGCICYPEKEDREGDYYDKAPGI